MPPFFFCPTIGGGLGPFVYASVESGGTKLAHISVYLLTKVIIRLTRLVTAIQHDVLHLYPTNVVFFVSQLLSVQLFQEPIKNYAII